MRHKTHYLRSKCTNIRKVSEYLPEAPSQSRVSEWKRQIKNMLDKRWLEESEQLSPGHNID